jgi:hypothetical protein
VPAGPSGRRRAADLPSSASVPRAATARRDDRRRRAHRQRAARHPRRQRARPGAVPGDVRRPGAPERRALRVPGPRARDFYLDWDRIARDIVASLRSAAGHNPYDRDLSDLVGELSTRSKEFRQLWARHDVRFHISGVKHFHHAQVGDLELNYERLEVVFDTDLTIFAYTAEPGTRSADALSLLGSLAATTNAERASAAP